MNKTKVMISGEWQKTFVCRGVNANLELVDKFCYLGDILSVD